MSSLSNESSPRRSRAGLLIAAGVIALVVVMGVIVTIAALAGDDESAAEPPPTGATSGATATSSPANPDASLCGLPGLETEGNLATPPAGVTWELIDRIAVPASEAAGPGVVEESGLRYCYAHTPEGALLAAANVYGVGDTAQNDPVGLVERRVAAGPGYDVALAQARNGPPTEEVPESFQLQIRGFRMLAYTSKSALIDLAFQAGPNGTLVHQPIELVWQDGDWRVRVNPDGTLTPASAMPDLTGYVPWAGA